MPESEEFKWTVKLHESHCTFVSVVALTLTLGFSLAQEGDAEALAIVQEVSRQFEETASQHDAAAMAQLYTEDAYDLFEGYEYIGREAIEEGYKGTFDYGVTLCILIHSRSHAVSHVSQKRSLSDLQRHFDKVLYNAN